MDIILYTKEKCPRCKALKDFLDKYKIFYLEKQLEDNLVMRELMTYEYIRENFCDETQCLVLTPVVNIDGKWMHNEFFGIGGLNEEKIKKVLRIK